MESVNLTLNDIKMLESKRINAGSDGTIYRLGNGLIYKIYHKSMPLEHMFSQNLCDFDEEGVRIFRKENFRRPKLQVEAGVSHALDSYVKLRAEDAISFAMKLQKNVKLTTLPLAPIYVNHRFRGCVLKDFRWSTSIYNVLNFPLKIRLKIAKQILEADKELLENHIYRIDLGVKPKNKSNVLFCYFPTWKPEIIDNDGRSTIYTEQYISSFYKDSIHSLNCLLLEILFCYPVKELVDSITKLQGKILLEENHVPSFYIDKLIEQNASLEELDACLSRMLKR